MTSLVIGASSVAQLEANVVALDNLDFTAEELAEIEGHLAWLSPSMHVAAGGSFTRIYSPS